MSREAAPDFSPARKRRVVGLAENKPGKGGRFSAALSGLDVSRQCLSQGLRPGLKSGAASRLILLPEQRHFSSVVHTFVPNLSSALARRSFRSFMSCLYLFSAIAPDSFCASRSAI